MARIMLRGKPVNTVGALPSIGAPAPRFTLTSGDLGTIETAHYRRCPILLNVFPSVDTGVCATSVRTFNHEAASTNAEILCVSNDLPFALKRFCGAEGIANVDVASAFRSTFGRDYGLTIVDGPMAGLLARAVVVIGTAGTVSYTQLVSEVADEPDYDAALNALNTA